MITNTSNTAVQYTTKAIHAQNRLHQPFIAVYINSSQPSTPTLTKVREEEAHNAHNAGAHDAHAQEASSGSAYPREHEHGDEHAAPETIQPAVYAHQY